MATINNLFEYAARKGLRFSSVRGELTVEQLWQLPLRSRDEANLDAVAKTVNKALKAATEESFVDKKTKTSGQEELQAKLDIVLHVINTKIAEEEAAAEAARTRVEKKAEMDLLLQVRAEKKEGKLSKLSEAELDRRIAALQSELK